MIGNIEKMRMTALLRVRVQGFGWGKTRGTGKRRDGDEFNVRVI